MVGPEVTFTSTAVPGVAVPVTVGKSAPVAPVIVGGATTVVVGLAVPTVYVKDALRSLAYFLSEE